MGIKAAGYGGIAAVSRVTRIAASTIGRGLKDIEATPRNPTRTLLDSDRICMSEGISWNAD
jgi:hypothetical protein